MKKVTHYIRRNKKYFVSNLKACLKIPSVSGSVKNEEDIIRCAEFLMRKLRNIGFKKVNIFKTSGSPIVFGEWIVDADKPTVLIYGHYDVQPPDPLNEWKSPPFEPQIRQGNLYARGVIDDKGQIYVHLSALEAFVKTLGRPPVNVKVLIEGEEEIGSMHLEAFLKKYKKMLKADMVVISDTPMLDQGSPAICYGLRGLCYMEIEVGGPCRDLHSGGFGGVVENPAQALVGILSKLKNHHGKIMVPGFYKGVRPLSKKERKRISQVPFSEKKMGKEIGVRGFVGEKGYTTLEKMWARPTLDINGMISGFTGKGSKTIIPSRASAKVSMRLVPDQDPKVIARSFKRYVQKIAARHVRVRVIQHHGSPAFLNQVEHPIFEKTQNVLQKVFGTKAYYIREGGSIPFVKTISKILKKPCILVGFVLPNENAHAPNERMSLKNYQKGILSMAHWYDLIGQMKGAPSKRFS